ncbi:MAG: ABC transporter ATP-binding protein [Paracoccaceae bacterium]
MTVRRAGRATVERAALTLSAGEFVGLIGPNGAGKTTLLRAALGLLPHEGGSSLSALPAAARARAAAFLPQAREIAWPVTVAALVALGRVGRDDPAAVARALDRMGLATLADRRATELSGGEQARALIARALAQDTALLIADEPVAGLDPEAQLRTMQVFRDLADEGRGVLASIHDLGLAARFCDRLVMMQEGRIVANGPPREVLTDERLAQVFGIRAFHADTDEGPVFQPVAVIR